MSTNLSKLADELKPYFVPWVRKIAHGNGGGTGTGGTPDMLAHELASTSALGTFHTVSGLTAGQVLKATGATNAAFGQLLHSQLGGIGANDHHNQSHAYDSADHTGTLSWAKINFTGSSLGDLATRNYAQLNSRTHDIIGGDHSYTGGAALDVFGLSAASTLARITPSDSVSSAQTAILKATNGALSIDVLTAAAKVRSPLYDTSSGSITLSPAGTAVLPTSSIVKDLGDYNRKWRTLYAAELYVETLVAQDVLATIGGRIMVAPTTTLIADAASSDTTIDVKHNNITGAYVYLSSAPGGVAQVEVMKCGATATPITGGYRYTVTRNQDGTGANAWVSGDAVANIGAVAGQGWIELTSTNTVYSHLGPTITIYSRTGMAAWTDAKPVVSVGNLRSWVDYGADEFGFALGNDLALTKTTGFSGMTGDRTNGLRLFNSPIEMYNGATLVGKWWSNGQLDIGFDGITTLADRDLTINTGGFVRIGRTGANKPNLLYTTGGDLHLRSNTTPVITLAGDGSSYFAGPMGLGASGGIYQGTGTFASPTTGIKIWNDSGIGRIAGYKSGVLQVGFTSSGVLTAGAGAVILDADGATIVSGSKVESTLEPLPPAGYAWGYGSTWATTNALTLAVPGYAGDYFDASMWAYTNTYPDNASIQSQRDVRLRMVAPSRAYGLLARMVVGVNNSGMDIVERTDGWTSTLPDIHGVHIKVSNAQRLVATATGIDMYGAVTASSTISATGAISTGSTLTVTGIITANSGATILDRSSATYRGLSMLAVPGSAWAFGLTYRNSSDTMLGAWGAYGGADTLSYLYSGVNYNDTTLRVYPATDRVGIGADVVPAFTLDVAGDVNATGTFRRNGTEGNILIFIPPFNLTDTGSTTWSGVTRAAGSYHFDVQLNGNGLPDAARGVLVWLSGTWSGANNSYYCALYQYGSSTLVGNIRAYASAISIDAQISVPLDSSGRFTATVAGAVSMTNAYMRIIGYYI